MFIHCKKIIAAGAALLLCLLANTAAAEPYLAVKNNVQCSACHTNPAGGGARTTYGAWYGTHQLPQTAGSLNLFDAGKLGETLRIGADLRTNYYQSDRDEAEDARGFETQSGQLYVVLQPKDSRFALYIDEQIAPGGALNREAFILTKLNGQHFLKAGRIMLPYGIRLEDDSAFIRQASGFNFDTGDNGVELGLQYSKTLFNFAISNGSSGLNNDDKNLQFLSRAEYLGSNWRIGATALYNDAEAGARTQANVFGGFVWQGFVFLAEADLIKDESIENISGEYQQQRVGLLEVNREISKGYNVKLTTEFLDPDTNIDENHRVRHSLLLEYTPFANLQIRGGLRQGDDIPQRATGNYLDMFAQLHFYY
ncbi:hypothetical protein [Cellvibrio sp. KY-YJ-3]|uniref:hypothetical protein n=1 Tax=Cellvibrio sp. KY-YJ-3 TaxID=454662 RepID=UPI001246C944|nr:hypothetical protein [Cellvibrio sp. KY-YJ-3]QEY11516.1 hypothetical protein D0B88_04075 [Cellvibrio sp. KY-YJ-3]